MPETVIRPAFPAQEVAAEYIEPYHEHLVDAKILWLFTTAKRTRGGQVVLGTSARTNPLQRYLSSGNESVQTGYDFIVQIEEKRWRTMLRTQQHALVDHLLCRMVQREVINKRTGETSTSWATVGPDIEEFVDVLERHGVWLPEQQRFAAVVKKGKTIAMTLPDPRGDGDDKQQVRSSPDEPERRVTTVEGDGTVVQTEMISGGTTTEVDPEQPNTNGHAPGWQDQVGIGASEHEQRRRGRARANT